MDRAYNPNLPNRGCSGIGWRRDMPCLSLLTSTITIHIDVHRFAVTGVVAEEVRRMQGRRTIFIVFVVVVAAMAASVQMTATQGSRSTPTFNRDVLPILQRNCQGCHRPGEI